MKHVLQVVKGAMVVFFLFAPIVSCTKIPKIQIDYRLPPKKVDLQNKKVLLTFKDNRNPKDIIGAGAKSDYKNYANNFSYSLARGIERGFKIGVFDLHDLFMETFKNRLENAGIKVQTEQGGENAELEIVLNEFLLDLVNRTWTFSMAYEAILMIDGEFLGKQTISGNGERLKLYGRREADALVGEIYTDMVNRLNLEKLFRQGGL